jgi:hypothetical protein
MPVLLWTMYSSCLHTMRASVINTLVLGAGAAYMGAALTVNAAVQGPVQVLLTALEEEGETGRPD